MTTIYKIHIVDSDSENLETIKSLEFTDLREYFKYLNIYLSTSIKIENEEFVQNFTSHMTLKGQKINDYEFPTEEITSVFVTRHRY